MFIVRMGQVVFPFQVRHLEKGRNAHFWNQCSPRISSVNAPITGTREMD